MTTRWPALITLNLLGSTTLTGLNQQGQYSGIQVWGGAGWKLPVKPVLPLALSFGAVLRSTATIIWTGSSSKANGLWDSMSHSELSKQLESNSIRQMDVHVDNKVLPLRVCEPSYLWLGAIFILSQPPGSKDHIPPTAFEKVTLERDVKAAA
jgi:hypothetical protein